MPGQVIDDRRLNSSQKRLLVIGRHFDVGEVDAEMTAGQLLSQSH